MAQLDVLLNVLDHRLLFALDEAVAEELKWHEENHNDHSQNTDERTRHVGRLIDNFGAGLFIGFCKLIVGVEITRFVRLAEALTM